MRPSAASFSASRGWALAATAILVCILPPSTAATSQPLLLLMQANMSSTCAGRCTLHVEASSCLPGRPNRTTSAALLQPWNTIEVAAPRPDLQLAATVHCRGACQVTPSSHALQPWRGQACASALPAQNESSVLPFTTGSGTNTSGSAFFTQYVAGGQAVVHVAPRLPPTWAVLSIYSKRVIGQVALVAWLLVCPLAGWWITAGGKAA